MGSCVCLSFPFCGQELKIPCISPAYIAGVTNPIFEASRAWDLLLDISTGSVTVAKDIHITYPATVTVGLGGPLLTRSGTLKVESSITSEDELIRMAKEGSKAESGKDHNTDKVFIEDVTKLPPSSYYFSESPIFNRSVQPLRTILEKHLFVYDSPNMSPVSLGSHLATRKKLPGIPF